MSVLLANNPPKTEKDLFIIIISGANWKAAVTSMTTKLYELSESLLENIYTFLIVYQS